MRSRIGTAYVCLAMGLLPVSLVMADAPVIQNVVGAADFQPGIASSGWLAITGANLSSTVRAWQDGDFINGNLPTSLDGVKVTINGLPAYVYFVSPAQINVLAPDDPATGPVPVQVMNSQGTSNVFSAKKQVTAPAFFNYSQLGGRYSVIQAAGTFDLVGPPGVLGASVQTFVAAPGENIVLYATGLGPVLSGQPTGKLVDVASPLALPIDLSIGNVPATILYAGLIGSGLYQINAVVPDLPRGDAPILVKINGTAGPGAAFIPIQPYPGRFGPTAPAVQGCLSGQVDSMTYSTSALTFNLPDEMSVGGQRLCSTCAVKSPLYAQLAAQLERSLRQKKNVQACYDAKGNVVQVRVLRP